MTHFRNQISDVPLLNLQTLNSYLDKLHQFFLLLHFMKNIFSLFRIRLTILKWKIYEKSEIMNSMQNIEEKPSIEILRGNIFFFYILGPNH